MSKRLGRLVVGLWTGPERYVRKGLDWRGWNPFLPYAWSVRLWRFEVSWLVPDWRHPRKMSRQERRHIERKLLAEGKSVVFMNVRGRSL